MRAILPYALLTVAGFLAFSNALHNPFVFDDVDAIVGNPHLGSLWPPAAALAAPPGSGASGRPLVALSLAVNHALGGLDPTGYHVFNLLVHLLAAAVLFTLARGTLGAWRDGLAGGRRGAALAFAASILWVVHPLHTAVQDHVIDRNESMAAFCLLIVLECVRRAATTARGAWRWGAAAVVANAAGMACKETMAAAPLLALLYDRTFCSGSFRAALAARWRLHAGLAAGWLVLAACVATGDRGASVTQRYADVSRLDYARTQLGVIAHDLRLACWPHPLVLDYDWQVAHDLGTVAGPGLLVGLLLAATVVALVRRPAHGFLGAVFFLVLAPSSSIVPLTGAIAADHRMYVPLAAVVMATVCLAHSGLGRIGVLRTAVGRRLSAAVVVMVVLALVLGSRARNRDYATNVRIWQVTADTVPHNPRAHGNLGAALLQEGRIDEAVPPLQTAVALQPDFAVARANLALAHRTLGLRAAAADIPDSAIAHLRETIRFAPEDGVALNALAWILATTSDASQREPAAAVSYAERAVRTREPVPPDFLDTLAAAHAAAGDWTAALREATEARELALRAGQVDLAEAIGRRMALYAAGRAVGASNPDAR